MNQMQDDVYYACFADAANQSVATHDSGCPVFQVARTGVKMCDKALPMKGSAKKCTCDLVVTPQSIVGGSLS